MPVGIIDRLKTVQIDIHQADSLAFPVVVNVFIKASAVVKARKEIRVGAVQDLFLQAALDVYKRQGLG